jgi:hypothetical protein
MYRLQTVGFFGLCPSSSWYCKELESTEFQKLNLFPSAREGGGDLLFKVPSITGQHISESQSQSYITTYGQPASLPCCQSPIWDPQPNFLLFLWLFLDSYWFVVVGCSLWREVGSVVVSFCWVSPAQPFSGLNPTSFMSMFYCLYFLDYPNTEGQVPVVISPRNRIAQLYPGHWVTATYVHVQVILWPTVSRLVCLGVGTPTEAHAQIYYCQAIAVFILRGVLPDERTGL